MQKPLRPSILSDPNHEFVKTIIYIYSMESFVFKEMNRACREKDISKIEYYGPLASALSFIIYCGNQRKSNGSTTENFTVYRGLKVSEQELEEKYKIGNVFNLQGYTSSTLNREIAKSFAFDDDNIRNQVKDKTPLLIEIQFRGHQQFFSLNSSDYSAYPNE